MTRSEPYYQMSEDEKKIQMLEMRIIRLEENVRIECDEHFIFQKDCDKCNSKTKEFLKDKTFPQVGDREYKELPTKLELSVYLDYDSDTGIFYWKKSPSNNVKVGQIAGCKTSSGGKKYIHIRFNGVLYHAHRLAWVMFYEEAPKKEIDHINGNGLDNSIENLRDVSRGENCKNVKKRCDNKSGVCGVYKSDSCNSWIAEIRHNGVKIHIGSFKSLDEAAEKRKEYEITLGFHENHGRHPDDEEAKTFIKKAVDSGAYDI